MALLRITRVVGVYLFAVTAIAMPKDSRAQGTLIPLTTRRGMVFDYSGKYLYITTSDGFA